MSFLALSTAEALGLALLTGTIVVVLFFLRLRQRRVVVGSSMLWQRVFDDRQPVSLIERLRRWLSLALALLIALLIALSLGRPYPTILGSAPRPIVIVLDTSPSMNTITRVGSTRWNAATAGARQILDQASSFGGFMIADTANRVQTLLTEDRGELEEALDRMEPYPGQQEFPEIPVPDADVYFITDGGGQVEAPADVTTISVYEVADNVGIVAFEVQVDPTSPSGYAAYVEVVNYSTGPEEVAILLSGVGERRIGRNVELEPGESWSEAFDLAEFEGGGLRLRVQAEGDALALDNTAFSYLPARSDTRVTLVTATPDGYLETLLALSPRVELTLTTPDQFEEEVATDVYIFEGFAPETRPSASSLVFGRTGPGWLPPSTGTVEGARITSWDAEHPVMRFVPVHDLEIDSALSIETGDWQVLAGSEETPLMAVDEGPARVVFVGFDPEISDFPLSLGFPIFIENVLAWFSGDTLARAHSLGPVEFPEEADRVTGLDGDPVPMERRYGRTVIEAMEPELFTATANGRRLRVATNLGDRRISDVNRGRFATSGDRVEALVPGAGELWFYMLLAALVLLTAEWWTYHRRITL